MSKAFLFVFQNKLLSKTGTQLHTSVRFRSICVINLSYFKDLKNLMVYTAALKVESSLRLERLLLLSLTAAFPLLRCQS